MSLVAVLVALAAIFVALALLSAGAVTMLVRRWPPTGASVLGRSTTWRAAILAAPAVVATLGCVALVSSAVLEQCHCSEHALHHPHLCLTHPFFAQPLLGPAIWIVSAWVLVVAGRVVALGRTVVESHRWMSTARLAPIHMVDGICVRIVECSSRTAFTIGTFAPLIVFDRTLWDELSEEQREAVVHHESGHATRRDGLTLLALRICQALFSLRAAPQLIEGWRAAAEARCDLYAAAKLGDAAAVAEALVAVARSRAEHSAIDAPTPAMAMGVGADGSLEQRVVALLNTAAGTKSRVALTNDVLAITLFAFAAAIGTWMWPGDSWHHGVETLVGFFV